MTSNIINLISDGRDFRELDPIEKILWRTSGFRTPQGSSPQEALMRLKAQASFHPDIVPAKVAVIRTLAFRISAAAASLIMILGLWFMFRPGYTDKVIALRGSHLEHSLPDGSMVSINADSRLAYDQKHFGEERKVGLTGEAFFSVVKGSRFVVSTKHGDVAVLGTSFNVYARDEYFKVSCITGRVRVTSSGSTAEISPGENAELENGQLVVSGAKDTQASTGWIRGEFIYDNSPLNQVLNEIERQFNIKFVAGDLDGRYFTGAFTNKDLKNALDIVCIPMGLTYVVGEKGKVYIREKTRQ
jgi:transmembrane sensor